MREPNYLGLAVAEFLLTHQMLKKDLATQLGVTPTTVSYWLKYPRRMSRGPKSYLIEKLMDLMGLEGEARKEFKEKTGFVYYETGPFSPTIDIYKIFPKFDLFNIRLRCDCCGNFQVLRDVRLLHEGEKLSVQKITCPACRNIFICPVRVTTVANPSRMYSKNVS